MISERAVVYPNVKLGKGCVIEDFAIVGMPPAGCAPGELETIIGDGAIIRAHTILYAGNVIGSHFQTGNKANIRECNEIGDDVSIGTLSVVEHHVRISSGVRIHTQAFIPEFTILEEKCWIGPNVVITNAKYPRSPNVKNQLKGVHIMPRAIISANATLLPGVKIGVHALVGAGSVVTKDVSDGIVVAGNPARPIGKVSDLPY
ncbi:MAG: transferase [Fibrobacterota bacterium]|nr:transferase [Fibrobacterota bacterium]